MPTPPIPIIADDAETALNKSGNAVGHFDIFSILRGDYVSRFDAHQVATNDNPLDITYVLENPGGERRSAAGWKYVGNEWWAQSNDALDGKVGDYYIERWIAISMPMPQQPLPLPTAHEQVS